MPTDYYAPLLQALPELRVVTAQYDDKIRPSFGEDFASVPDEDDAAF